MTAPVRLQLSRRRGFRLQPHSLCTNGLPAINVARPGPWGNPFVGGQHGDAATCVARYRALVTSALIDMTVQPCPAYADLVNAQVQARDHLRTLIGHNLACWCALGKSCHADVLLVLANELRSG